MIIALVDEVKNELNLQNYAAQIIDVVKRFGCLVDRVDPDQVVVSTDEGDSYVRESVYHAIKKRLITIEGIGKHARTYMYKQRDGVEVYQKVIFVYRR